MISSSSYFPLKGLLYGSYKMIVHGFPVDPVCTFKKIVLLTISISYQLIITKIRASDFFGNLQLSLLCNIYHICLYYVSSNARKTERQKNRKTVKQKNRKTEKQTDRVNYREASFLKIISLEYSSCYIELLYVGLAALGLHTTTQKT